MIEIDEELAVEAAAGRLERERIDQLLADRLIEAGLSDVMQPAAATIADLSLDGSICDVMVEAGELQPRRWLLFENTQARAGRLWRRRLELFSQTIGPSRRNKFRMVVVSAGLVGEYELKRKISSLRAIVRRIANDDRLRGLGVRVHFANVETTIYRRTEDGGTQSILYNLHSHLILEATRFLSNIWRDVAANRDLDPTIETDKARLRKLDKATREGRITLGYECRSGWTDVLDRMRELNTLKHYAHDAGKVENFAELLKYMTKGSATLDADHDVRSDDLERIGLLDLSPLELGTYAVAIHRCNRFQAYGELKVFVRDVAFEIEEFDPDTGEVYAEPRIIKNKIVVIEEGKLAVTPVFPRDLRPQYNNSGGSDIIVGLTVRANPAGELVGCVRVLNPSSESLADVNSLIQKRALHDLAEEHAAILAARRAARAAVYMKHTRQLSCAPRCGFGGADPPVDAGESA